MASILYYPIFLKPQLQDSSSGEGRDVIIKAMLEDPNQVERRNLAIACCDQGVFKSQT